MSQIKEEESTLEGPHGHKLRELKWFNPESDPKGLVFLCHGYDEHIQYYNELGNKLVENGFLAFGHDHPGHGKSSGPILQSSCFEKDYADNVIFNCELKLKEYENKIPLYIIGHSMGGLVACRALIKQPQLFRAAVLMGPALMLPPEHTTSLKVFGVRFISSFLPGFPVGQLSLEEITRDVERLSGIKSDPLRGRSSTKAGFAVAFFDEIKAVESALSSISVPVLIQHGEKDSIIPPLASDIVFNSISSTQKSKHLYPEAFHNLYHELPEVRKEAIGEAVQWILDNHEKS